MEQKTILNLNKKEFMSAEKWYQETYIKDQDGLKEAEQIVKALSLGGLWRGYYSAVRIIYEYKKEGKVPLFRFI